MFNLGKIDQKMQKDRYTPIYNRQVGIVNGKLINEKQFKDKWTAVFDEKIKDYKGKLPYSEE